MQQTILLIAMMCHAANKAWCEANGDNTQKSWADADQWQRDSAVSGVEFRLKNPRAKEDAQHNAWMADKVNDGWVYGEVKDPTAKTHPCIVPFEKLPVFQQQKDKIFCAIVDALAPAPTELSYGQKAVGITFNPGGMPQVNSIKKLCAATIDEMNDQMQSAIAENNGEKIAQYKLAMRDIQTGQMWGVKAATWQY